MNDLMIEKTRSTPYINFNPVTNLLVIMGESFPKNAAKFYAPILEWLKDYINALDTQEVTVEFEIIYFNSSTSKIFMTIFGLLDKAVENGKKIGVNWKCDKQNETSIECGEEFKENLTHLPFNIVFVQGI